MHRLVLFLASLLFVSGAVLACSGGSGGGGIKAGGCGCATKAGGCGCCAKQGAQPVAPMNPPMTPAVVASNKFCPLSGEPVNPDVPTSMYQGRVIGFCCPGCKAEFDANPAAYAAKIR